MTARSAVVIAKDVWSALRRSALPKAGVFGLALVSVTCIAAVAQTGQSSQTQTQANQAQTGLLVDDVQPRLVAARAAVKRHAELLRAGLTDALRTGGVKGAIGACTSIAPEIDGKVAELTGFEIGRTSLKVRNPENAPDAWEKTVLEAFASKLASGTDAKTLEAHDAQVTADGQRLFRYMRPIMMVDSCLACHGPNISQDLKALVARSYSDDKAIGFNLGELRGAFSLVQVMD